MIGIRDSSTVMVSDNVRFMKLVWSLYSVRVIVGLRLALQFYPNGLLTLTSKVNVNLYNPNPPN